MNKLVIHIFHVHENAAITGAKLAERVRQAAARLNLFPISERRPASADFLKGKPS